jgi:hypothetical protein
LAWGGLDPVEEDLNEGVKELVKELEFKVLEKE